MEKMGLLPVVVVVDLLFLMVLWFVLVVTVQMVKF